MAHPFSIRELPSRDELASRSKEELLDLFDGLREQSVPEVQPESSFLELDELFHTVFHNASIGIVIIDMFGVPVLGNPAFYKWLGYTPDELSLRPLSELTHLDDLEKDLALYLELQANLIQSYSIEKRFVHTSGVSLWGEVLATRLDGGTGERTETLVMVRDITVQKQTEAHLRQANQTLLETKQVLEDFAFAAAHDLCEPINTLGNAIKYFQTKLAPELLNAKAKTALSFATQASSQMSTMVQGLLDFTRIHQSDEVVEEVEMEALCLEVQEALASTIRSLSYDERQRAPTALHGR